MSRIGAVFFLINLIINSQPIFCQAKLETPFIQEYHVPYPIDDSEAANDVRSLAVDLQGNVWAATKAGIFLLSTGQTHWEKKMSAADEGPAFYAMGDSKNNVWLGAWNGAYKAAKNELQKISGIDGPIFIVGELEDAIVALGTETMWLFQHGEWLQQRMPFSRRLRQAIADKNGGYWVATGMGLYHHTADQNRLFQNEEELLSADVRDLAFNDKGRLWIAGLGGITIYQGEKRIGQITQKDGLPDIDVNALAKAPDGKMWIGTNHGVARFNGKNWSLLFGQRWLLDDEVRDIIFDTVGTGWIATAKGVSAIKQKKMTLAQKANHFFRVTYQRHVRPPYLVEKNLLPVPGDTTKWEPLDDDNDGQYTSLYLAMESFRYAVTKSPEAKERAQKAFEALRFLQTVTATPGFVARTVIPSEWKRMFDPNREYTARDWAEIQFREPRYKPMEKRWRLSGDGKWLWKGDTSSDEITGHMFGYLFYFDLVANKKEKKRVAEHVCKIVDYIINGGFVLRDIDGKHTRWGVWAPERLNFDPDWKAERGINSVEILSYLKLAYHVSGKEMYQSEYLKLLHEFNYIENVQQAKTFNPSWITHIDDELLALAFPCLLLHERDSALLKLYRDSLDRWYSGVQADESPYFDFTYAMLSDFLPDVPRILQWFCDTPLDLVRWRLDNAGRMDVRIVRSPELENLQTDRMLPISERSFFRWDNNPWYAVQGDGGHTEADGVFWLLPYWIGRYLGFIDATN